MIYNTSYVLFKELTNPGSILGGTSVPLKKFVLFNLGINDCQYKEDFTVMFFVSIFMKFDQVMRFEFLTSMQVPSVVFLTVTSCSLDDGGVTSLRNVGHHLQDYIASQT
jgi:hypothetical protein